MYAIESLGKALEEYQGATIVVSHDDDFIRQLKSDSVFMISKKTRSLLKLENGVDEYIKKILKKK